MKTYERILRVAGIVIVSTLCPAASFAAEPTSPRYSARVCVEISADNDLKTLVTSYVNRELRSLGDVTITDERTDWTIAIVAIKPKTVHGVTAGVALSTVMKQAYDPAVVQLLLAGHKNKDFITEQLKFLYWDPHHVLNVGAEEDLQDICKELVAKFDMDCLEPARKIHREVTDQLEEAKKRHEQKKKK